jgi:hypothetical protein
MGRWRGLLAPIAVTGSGYGNLSVAFASIISARRSQRVATSLA